MAERISKTLWRCTRWSSTGLATSKTPLPSRSRLAQISCKPIIDQRAWLTSAAFGWPS